MLCMHAMPVTKMHTPIHRPAALLNICFAIFFIGYDIPCCLLNATLSYWLIYRAFSLPASIRNWRLASTNVHWQETVEQKTKVHAVLLVGCSWQAETAMMSSGGSRYHRRLQDHQRMHTVLGRSAYLGVARGSNIRGRRPVMALATNWHIAL